MRRYITPFLFTTAAVIAVLSMTDTAHALTKKKKSCDDIKEDLINTLTDGQDEIYAVRQNQRNAIDAYANAYSAGAFSCQDDPKQAARDSIDGVSNWATEMQVLQSAMGNSDALNSAAADASDAGCTNIDFNWLREQNLALINAIGDAKAAAAQAALDAIDNTDPPPCAEPEPEPAPSSTSDVTAGAADNAVGTFDASGAVNLR